MYTNLDESHKLDVDLKKSDGKEHTLCDYM